MTKSLNILIIEDYPADAMLMVRRIEKAGYDIKYRVVDTPETLQDALKSRCWDVVLSDYSLPKLSCIRALLWVKRRAADIPFILVTGAITRREAGIILDAGANAYVSKDQPDELIKVIEWEVARSSKKRTIMEGQKTSFDAGDPVTFQPQPN